MEDKVLKEEMVELEETLDEKVCDSKEENDFDEVSDNGLLPAILSIYSSMWYVESRRIWPL